MLIRSVGNGGALVLGGDHPGVISVIKVGGSRAKLGLDVHADVPIFNLKVLRAIIRNELQNASSKRPDVRKTLLEHEVLALRSMLVLLEQPLDNSAAIAELMADPALVDLTFGAQPDEE